MKQLENNNVCKYCFGCNKLEDENFEGIKNCKNFVPAVKDWYEEYIKSFKEEKKDENND